MEPVIEVDKVEYKFTAEVAWVMRVARRATFWISKEVSVPALKFRNRWIRKWRLLLV